MNDTATETPKRAAPAAPIEPLRVNGLTAAALMGVSKSTFYERVNSGMYPKAGQDGLWSVRLLRECSERLDGQASTPT